MGRKSEQMKAALADAIVAQPVASVEAAVQELRDAGLVAEADELATVLAKRQDQLDAARAQKAQEDEAERQRTIAAAKAKFDDRAAEYVVLRDEALEALATYVELAAPGIEAHRKMQAAALELDSSDRRHDRTTGHGEGDLREGRALQDGPQRQLQLEAAVGGGMKLTADDLRILIPEAIRQGQADVWRKRQSMKMQLTAEDLRIVLNDGLITPKEAENVEIVEEYTYPPEIEKALGIRAGQRPHPVR